MAGGSPPFIRCVVPGVHCVAGITGLDLSAWIQIATARSSNRHIERGQSLGTEVLIGGWRRRLWSVSSGSELPSIPSCVLYTDHATGPRGNAVLRCHVPRFGVQRVACFT